VSVCGGWSLVKQSPVERRGKVLRCRSWRCDECAPIRRRQLMALAAAGNPVRFVTLTINPAVGLSPADRLGMLSHAWRTLVKRARRRWPTATLDYLAIVEATRLGEPHLHILLRSPFLPQRVLSVAMQDLIGAPVVDIRKIRNQREVVRYVAKYITKAPEQFGSAKRYWHTPDYEVEKWSPEKDEATPTGRWSIDRRSYRAIITEWSLEGWYEIDDDSPIVRFICDIPEARDRGPPRVALSRQMSFV